MKRRSGPTAANDTRSRASAWQVSLRGLLLLVGSVCVLTGLCIAPAFRRSCAVNAVLSLGGSVGYREDQQSNEFGYNQPMVTSLDEHRLLDDLFKTVIDVDLENTNADDALCRQLLELQSLETIDLADTNVSDEGVRLLAMLPEIRKVSLARTNVGDETLVAFCALRHLTWLTLSETKVTDDGLLELLRHLHLRVLALDGTHVTYATVRALTAQTGLISLSLYGIDASVEALDELAEALSECIISY